jgi:hypothetical protein
MDFELKQEQLQFRDSVSGWARRSLADGSLERAHSPSFPFDVAKKAVEMGLLGITIPEADGGMGGTLMDAVIAIEAVALVCPKSADVIQAGNFGPIRTFAEYATPDQKARYLTGLLAGETVIGLGMTEAEAGSAVTDLKTEARPAPDGDGWLLKGGKVFTSHSVEADVFLVYCRFGEGVGQIGSVIVERGMEGFTFGKPATYLNGETWCPLFFDDVHIPRGNLLLGPGGFKKQITGFNAERIGNSARALAVGRFAFNTARDYAAQRRQFGRTLSDFQGMQWKFADIHARMEAAQLLLYRAALSADRGLPDAQQTAVAKLMCNEVGFAASDMAMQAMGGMGYCNESLVEYCFRNRIAEGVFDTRFSQRGVRA